MGVKDESWDAMFNLIKNGIILYGAILLPKVFKGMLPQPGDGPDRKTMEEGCLIVHGIGKMASSTTTSSGSSETEESVQKKVKAKFQFNKDVSYLYTAVLLVETGILLVEKC